MKTEILVVHAILVVTALAFPVGCGGGSNGGANSNQVIPVEVATVEQRRVQRELTFAGNIQAWRETNFGAQSTGRIEKIFVEEGDEVKKGEILVRMDDTQLTQARIRYQIAKADHERMAPLLEKGSISPQQFERVKAEYETSEAAYELMLRNTQLRAPFSGVVTAKKMNEGEVFTMMPAQGGPPAIVTVMQIDPLKVMINVTESEFPRIRTAMSAEITVDIYPDSGFRGEVSRIDPVIDDNSRTFAVEIKVPNRDRVLRPGMFARVKLVVGEEDVLVVPRAAIIRQQGSSVTYCFVVENDRARRREVQAGVFVHDLMEVAQGLQAGSRIITAGQYRVKDGTAVTITSDDGDTAGSGPQTEVQP